MSNIRAKDAKTVELLARRARRLAEPLVAHIPGGELYVECAFGAGRYPDPWHVDISVHRALPDGSLAYMPLQETCLVNTVDVDRAIDKLRAIVEARSWPLDPSEQAAA